MEGGIFLNTKNNIRILHIIPGYGGGISSFVKNLAKGNHNKNIIYDVVGFTDYPKEFSNVIQKQQGTCYTLPSVYKNPFQVFIKYRKILGDKKYNFVHCHISGYKGFVFKLFTPGAKEHIIMHAHHVGNDEIDLSNNMNNRISQFFSIAFAAKYFTCSKQAGRYVYGKKIKAQFIPNGIEIYPYLKPLREDEAAKYHSEFGIHTQTKVIGHIGRFDRVKNQSYIVELAKILHEHNIDFKILLIGEGALKRDIENLVEENALSNHVLFLGYRYDIPTLIKIFDVMILPSFSEGLGISVIEAQAAGIPCIVANTIVQEVDMGMGMVKFIPLEEPLLWIKELMNESVQKLQSREIRLNAVKAKGFSLDEMQKAYLAALGIE